MNQTLPERAMTLAGRLLLEASHGQTHSDLQKGVDSRQTRGAMMPTSRKFGMALEPETKLAVALSQLNPSQGHPPRMWVVLKGSDQAGGYQSRAEHMKVTPLFR